jgi:hypothetical protein
VVFAFHSAAESAVVHSVVRRLLRVSVVARMTRRADILALASRVEAAGGADRALDGAIATALGWTEVHASFLRADLGRPPGVIDWWDHVPSYTASLDAALSLVPEGLAWTLGQNVHHHYWLASANSINADGAPFSVGNGTHTKYPALALTAAALRAIAEEVDQNV